MSKPITEFIEKYYLHFNAAALVDASKGYVAHLKDGGKMMITLPEQCLLRSWENSCRNDPSG
jgi:hypothetical protein